MTTNTVASYIRVILREEQGGYYAHSADLAGLSIWGENREQVCERAKEAVRVLYKLNNGQDVEVLEAADPSTLKRKAVCNDFIVARAA